MLNLEDQYDRIFKYLYFHLHDRHAAEDMTQEAFLRFLGSRMYRDENRLLQTIWSLRPNAVLMNTGFVNYRLIRLPGCLLLNYQAAPEIYVIISFAVFAIGRWKYRRLQVGNQ